MFKRLAVMDALRAQLPYTNPPYQEGQPRRKMLTAPFDKGSFVKATKQCFVKNPRLMPMTRIMVTLLFGWAGNGGPVTTTIGILAKHLGRSVRQTIRYLQDAIEEGLLFYARTKDRIGRYTGIKIYLNFGAIRYGTKKKAVKKPLKAAETLGMTYTAQTNEKDKIKKEIDPAFRSRIEAICKRNGIDPPPLPG